MLINGCHANKLDTLCSTQGARKAVICMYLLVSSQPNPFCPWDSDLRHSVIRLGASVHAVPLASLHSGSIWNNELSSIFVLKLMSLFLFCNLNFFFWCFYYLCLPYLIVSYGCRFLNLFLLHLVKYLTSVTLFIIPLMKWKSWYLIVFFFLMHYSKVTKDMEKLSLNPKEIDEANKYKRMYVSP